MGDTVRNVESLMLSSQSDFEAHLCVCMRVFPSSDAVLLISLPLDFKPSRPPAYHSFSHGQKVASSCFV